MAVPPTLPLDVERTDCTPSHCHSPVNVRSGNAQGRVAVPTTRGCTLRPEWQCHPHCQMASSVPKRYARVEWQCHPHGTARSGPSGSASHTATRRRAHGLHALTLPLNGERTVVVRSGPSGSATRTEPHAQGRVAVPSTLPNGIERTETVRLGSSGSADHAGLHAQGRVAVHLTLPLDGERAI